MRTGNGTIMVGLTSSYSLMPVLLHTYLLSMRLSLLNRPRTMSKFKYLKVMLTGLALLQLRFQWRSLRCIKTFLLIQWQWVKLVCLSLGTIKLMCWPIVVMQQLSY